MSYRDWEKEQQPVAMWPENIPVYELWTRIGDQWRYAMNGPVAMDHGPLLHELDRMGLEGEEYDQLYADIRVMAGAALAAIHAE